MSLSPVEITVSRRVRVASAASVVPGTALDRADEAPVDPVGGRGRARSDALARRRRRRATLERGFPAGGRRREGRRAPLRPGPQLPHATDAAGHQQEQERRGDEGLHGAEYASLRPRRRPVSTKAHAPTRPSPALDATRTVAVAYQIAFGRAARGLRPGRPDGGERASEVPGARPASPAHPARPRLWSLPGPPSLAPFGRRNLEGRDSWPSARSRNARPGRNARRSRRRRAGSPGARRKRRREKRPEVG